MAQRANTEWDTQETKRKRKWFVKNRGTEYDSRFRWLAEQALILKKYGRFEFENEDQLYELVVKKLN